jgi:hypothetical protein
MQCEFKILVMCLCLPVSEAKICLYLNPETLTLVTSHASHMRACTCLNLHQGLRQEYREHKRGRRSHRFLIRCAWEHVHSRGSGLQVLSPTGPDQLLAPAHRLLSLSCFFRAISTPKPKTKTRNLSCVNVPGLSQSTHTHTHTHTKHTQNTHTDAYGNNSLWVESAPFSFNHKPLELRCGQVARFYGNRCLHYTLPNDTPHTRITLDFRVGLSLSLLSLSPVSSLPPRPHSPKLNPKPLFRARNPAPFLDSLALVRKRVSRPENLGDSKSVLPHAVACWSLSVPGMPIRSLNPKA